MRIAVLRFVLFFGVLGLVMGCAPSTGVETATSPRDSAAVGGGELDSEAVEARMEAFLEELNLTPEQEAEWTAYRAQHRERVVPLMQRLQEASMREKRSIAQELRAADAEMVAFAEALFTDEQFAKWSQAREEIRAQVRERRGR